MDSTQYTPSIQNDESATSNQYDAFISYSRKNEDFAAKLEQALENYRPPKGLDAPQRRLNIFRDKHDFKVGDYHQNLEKSLMASAKLIIICSPEARSSQFVNEEIRQFATLKDSKNIIPILHSGIPNNEAGPDQAESMAFPAALCELMEMPLAANFLKFDNQKGKVNRDPYSDAWYTILAHIYDVSRDEIEQRDRRRRNRTLRMALIGLTGIIGVLSLLLVFAVISRQQADDARKDAVNQAKEATKQRGIAEGKTREAESERNNALTARNAEKRQRQEAERQRTNAERQTLIAIDQKNKAILAQAAEKRQRKTAQHQTKLAFLREQIALAMSELSTNKAFEGMVRAIAIYNDTQLYPETISLGREVLYSAIQQSYETNRLIDQDNSFSEVWALAIRPDGKQIATNSWNGPLRLRDYKTGKVIASTPSKYTLFSLAYSSNSKYLVGGGNNGFLGVWDANGTNISHKTIGESGESAIDSVAISPSGHLTASASFDGNVRIFSTRGLHETGPPLQRGGERGWSKACAAASFGKDDYSLASSRFNMNGKENFIQIWSRKNGLNWTLVSKIQHPSLICSMSYRHDGKIVATGGADGVVRLWDTLSGEQIGSSLNGHLHWVRSLAFSRDGNRLASSSYDNNIVLWNTDSDTMNYWQKGLVLRGHKDKVHRIAFNTDDGTIVSTSRDGTIRFWDASGGEAITKRFPVTPIDYSGAAHEEAKRIKLMSFFRSSSTSDPNFSPVLSSDGTKIATTSMESQVELWSLQKNHEYKLVKISLPFIERISAMKFSPTGGKLAVAYGNLIQILTVPDLKTSGPIMSEHTGNVTSLAFTPDSSLLASASIFDRTLTLWNPLTGRPIGAAMKGVLEVFSLTQQKKHGVGIVFSKEANLGNRLLETSPQAWLTISCKRIRNHGMVLDPLAFTSDPKLISIAYRARQVCGRLSQ